MWKRYIDDLLNPPLPGSKLFEELVLDFYISRQDRGKFYFLMKWILGPWLEDPHSKDINIFDNITSGLLHAHKIPKFTYSLFNETCLSNRDTEYLIAEEVLFIFLYSFSFLLLFFNYFSPPYLLTNFELKMILNCGFDCWNGYYCKHISYQLIFFFFFCITFALLFYIRYIILKLCYCCVLIGLQNFLQ